MKKTVCIIVDHPDRDLAGLTYLSEELAKKNFSVILVPMYFSHEVFLIKPTYLIINHARKGKDFSSGIDMLIKFSEDIGIKTFVLDTEGGLNFSNIYKKNLHESIHKVDKYFLWGKNKLKLVNKSAKKKFVVTGHPKYDLFKLDNYKTNKLESFKKKFPFKYILIITSFVNFVPEKSIKKDIRFFASKKATPEFEKKYMKSALKDFYNSIELLKFVIEQNPKEKFLIRPHPFENKDFYRKEFYRFKNVLIKNDGDIFFYFQNAKFVINHNCQTSFESVFAKKECINISSEVSERTSNLRNITLNVSEKTKLNKFLRKKATFSNSNKKNKFVFNYINNIKHNSASIILNEILKFKKNEPNDYTFFSIFKYYIESRGYISLFKFFIKITINPKFFLIIKDLFGFGMYYRKKITLKDVVNNVRKSSKKNLLIYKFNSKYFYKKISYFSNSYQISAKKNYN